MCTYLSTIVIWYYISGLQYMVEYTKNNPAVEERYVCELCDGKCDPRTLIPHIVGTKHRSNYVVSAAELPLSMPCITWT